jgi:pilus assembly protein Flp/PilA
VADRGGSAARVRIDDEEPRRGRWLRWAIVAGASRFPRVRSGQAAGLAAQAWRSQIKRSESSRADALANDPDPAAASLRVPFFPRDPRQENIPMTQLIARIQTFITQEDGSTMVEYGLMVALIAIACIGTVVLVGSNLSGLFTNISGSISG